jgi:hypothetical protein
MHYAVSDWLKHSNRAALLPYFFSRPKIGKIEVGVAVVKQGIGAISKDNSEG